MESEGGDITQHQEEEASEEIIEDYGGKTSKEDDEFDEIVGALQEIILGNEFVDIQKNFLNKHSG